MGLGPCHTCSRCCGRARRVLPPLSPLPPLFRSCLSVPGCGAFGLPTCAFSFRTGGFCGAAATRHRPPFSSSKNPRSSICFVLFFCLRSWPGRRRCGAAGPPRSAAARSPPTPFLAWTWLRVRCISTVFFFPSAFLYSCLSAPSSSFDLSCFGHSGLHDQPRSGCLLASGLGWLGDWSAFRRVGRSVMSLQVVCSSG